MSDCDLAAIGRLFADPARARILMALVDGRSLAGTVLADEAGVSASTASEHLTRLREAGLVDVERSGRHRYHRLANAQVATAIESLAALAPTTPVTSLRAHTRAAAMRTARTCYDHLAGRAGVELTARLVERGALVSTDGIVDTRRRDDDPISKPLPTHPWELGPDAGDVLAELGVDLPALAAERTRRPMLRFCLDWTEQRHHLGGRLGAAVLSGLLAQGWVVPSRRRRVLEVTDDGVASLGLAA